MAELVKKWNDGKDLTVTYTGSGDGQAIFTSEVNAGIDKEISVAFVDASRNITVERAVKQIGLREEYITSDGDVYMTADGNIYGCLK